MRLAVIGDAASVNVQRWCEGLADAGALVHVVSAAPAWDIRIPVWRLPLADRLGKARYLLLGASVRRAIASIDPDLVIGYFATGYGTLARLARRHPLVQVTAGDDVLVTPPRTLAHAMATRNLRAADLVIAWAPHMAEAVQGFGVPDGRILVQPRGIPLDGYPTEFRPTSPGTRLICSRSLRVEYRHEMILSAIADPLLHQVTLTLAGDGPDQAQLRRLCHELGIDDRVRFLGRVGNACLPDLLARHDVYVSAFPRDGVSASLLEAMAAGLLPVVADHVANRWWVDDEVTGLLFTPVPEALVQALRRATTDPVLRSTAARRGPEIVRRRGDLSVNMRRFMAAFEKLVL